MWINTCTLVAAAIASTGGGGRINGKTQFPFSVASAFQNGNTTWEDVWSFPYMYTGSSSYSFDCGGGGGVRNGKDPISLFCCISLPKWKDYMKSCWVFSVISSEPHWQNYYFPPPLADMLSWAVWFKFLPNEVFANTCLFILTSFSKQSASWKVLGLCELCALYWLAKDVSCE